LPTIGVWTFFSIQDKRVPIAAGIIIGVGVGVGIGIGIDPDPDPDTDPDTDGNQEQTDGWALPTMVRHSKSTRSIDSCEGVGGFEWWAVPTLRMHGRFCGMVGGAHRTLRGHRPPSPGRFDYDNDKGA
jgi:hypothetical protein